jgi:hypothetical protein
MGLMVMVYLSGSDFTKNLNCYIFWPFLSSMTRDPQNNTILRWKEDGKLHVFSETLGAAEIFQQWFHDEILQNGKPMNENHWDLLLKRYYKFHKFLVGRHILVWLICILHLPTSCMR